MVMESKDIQSDLRALKKLYGLIRNDRDETTNTDLLDEHSRLVLKNLLDAATKKVLLKLQSESEGEEASRTLPSEKEESASRSRLSMIADTKMDGLDASLLKENGEQSTLIVPASGSHKLCSVCQRNTVDVVRNSNRFTDPQKNECDGYIENNKQEMCTSDVDCHSREASGAVKQIEFSGAVKQIELCVSALHIEREGADQLHLFDNNGDQSCSLMCRIPTQRDTNPMLLLFQPTKAVILGQSFSSTSEMESLYHGHTAIEDEHRHLRIYKPSSCMNMINSENRHQESDEETCKNDSEEYSLKDGSREAEYVSSSSSGSWGTPQSRYSGYSSNSEEEVYSSSSRDEVAQLTFSSSSKTSDGYSSCEEPAPTRSYAKKSGPRACGVNQVKQSGIWNRLKERLSIIFHHHHHNHGDRRKMAPRATLNKRKGNMINFKRRDETHGEKAVEKTRKSLVHHKRQHSHFHGLVEGILRHVRHSKQSKTGKGNVGKHSRKKNLNKSHWWQLLQHHRGTQLHHHRKLGLGKEKCRVY